MRYLGIDYGTGKVGLALSDEGGVMGFPHGSVPNDEHLEDAILSLIGEKGVEKVVIGEPLTPGAASEGARALGERLVARGIPVAYEMEAFTTQEARRDMEGNRTKGPVDASAAALILTSYLSRPHGND